MLEEHFGDGSRWGVEIAYLHEDRPLGTAGALGLLPGRPASPLVVMNGDLLTNVNFRQLLDYHREHASAATVCVGEYTFQVPYGVVRLEKHRLLDIVEKPVQRAFVSAGIYVLEPAVLDLVPAGRPLDMPDLFRELIARDLPVATFPIREYWIDIGRRHDLERAQGEYPEVVG
jgi:NDP-sugar pyrophosphorylase family protein